MDPVNSSRVTAALPSLGRALLGDEVCPSLLLWLSPGSLRRHDQDLDVFGD